jgi:hypothetical protein
VNERERTLGAAGLALIGIAVEHGWLTAPFEVDRLKCELYLGNGARLPARRACVEYALGLMAAQGDVLNEHREEVETAGDMPLLVELMERAYGELLGRLP